MCKNQPMFRVLGDQSLFAKLTDLPMAPEHNEELSVGTEPVLSPDRPGFTPH